MFVSSTSNLFDVQSECIWKLTKSPSTDIYVPFYRNWILERICPDPSMDSNNQQSAPWCNGVYSGRPEESQSPAVSVTLPSASLTLLTAAPDTPTQVSIGGDDNTNECRKSGERCIDESDCCSGYCHSIPGIYSLCTESLRRTRVADAPFKWGGAAGAKGASIP